MEVSQIRFPYTSSGREFDLKRTIQESETKFARKLLDNYLFRGKAKITFFVIYTIIKKCRFNNFAKLGRHKRHLVDNVS